ncbi:MAG: hypothetical protein P4N59_10020 [Negativicutes bacterium]|nr:hypothetical protein [Negativicutes bacterium]
MAQFPSIQQPVYPLTTKIKDPSLQSEMENGLVISRAKFTRMPQSFVLKWNALPAADYAALRDFYRITVLGGSMTFEWNYPIVPNDPYSGQLFSVRFTGGDISFDLAAPGYYSGALTIQEV